MHSFASLLGIHCLSSTNYQAIMLQKVLQLSLPSVSTESFTPPSGFVDDVNPHSGSAVGIVPPWSVDVAPSSYAGRIIPGESCQSMGLYQLKVTSPSGQGLPVPPHPPPPAMLLDHTSQST